MKNSNTMASIVKKSMQNMIIIGALAVLFLIFWALNPNFFNSESKANLPFFEEAARILDLSSPKGITIPRAPTEKTNSSKRLGSIFPIRKLKNERWSN